MHALVLVVADGRLPPLGLHLVAHRDERARRLAPLGALADPTLHTQLYTLTTIPHSPRLPDSHPRQAGKRMQHHTVRLDHSVPLSHAMSFHPTSSHLISTT